MVTNITPNSTTISYSMNPISSIIDDLFMIGFGMDRNRHVKPTGFPFYNVIKKNDESFIIEIALAGFDQKDIEICEQNSTLIIKGSHSSESDEDYLFRGITKKSFTRNFALAEHVHVEHASMSNGILKISLKREIPEEAKPKMIAIAA